MNEPLVLLPAMMCDGRLFGPQIKKFGTGRAIHIAPTSSHETVEEMARSILSAAPMVFALAGAGLGGMIAMEIMRQAPNRVTRLAVISTTASAETSQVAADREPQIVRVMAGMLPEVLRENLNANRVTSGPLQQMIIDLGVEMGEALGEGAFLRQSRALQRRPDQQAILRRLELPTTIICGEHDQLYPSDRHEQMSHLIPSASLSILPRAAHFPTLECPEEVNEILSDWLGD